MDPVKFQLDDESKKRLETLIPPDKMRQATYQIVKRTTNKILRRVKNEVRDKILLTPQYRAEELKKILKSEVTGNPPVGTVTLTKHLLPLRAFKYSVSKDGVVVRVIKDGPPIVLRHAFVATVKAGASSHTAIFSRARHLPTTGPNVGLRNKHGGPKYKLTPEGIAGRFAIQEQFAPSIFKIISAPELLKSIDFDAAAELKKQAESQISRFATHEPIVDQTNSSDE